MSTIALQVGLLLFCLAMGAFLAGIETGLISINRLRLRHLVRHHVANAEILESFIRRPDHLLGTTLVGTNICHVTAAVMAADLATRALGPPGTAIAAAATTVVILIFCEYLPKAWFQSNPTLRALPFAPLLKWIGTALRPLSWAFGAAINLIIPAGRKTSCAGQPFVTRDELIHLAREGAQAGALTRDEHRMIRSVFQLRGKTCGDIMVPRERMVYVSLDTPTDEMLNLARATDVNRFPVFDPEQNGFAGIVHIYDVLADPESASKRAQDYVRPIQLVSHATPADHVLPRMRVTRQPLVLVTNERYEVIGLVTLADVLEEVVGQL